MPYVTPSRRDEIDPTAYLTYRAATPGDLTFMLTALVLRYLGPEPRFAGYAEVLGVLEATKLELYRRSVSAFEDKAIDRNGDLPYPS